MKNIYVMGSPGSGKTMVALGLSLKLRKEGINVGYFKPVGSPSRIPGKAEGDAHLMKETLGMSASLEVIAPHQAAYTYLSGNRRRESIDVIMNSFDEISRESDMVIIDGAVFPYVLGSWDLDSITLAQKLNAGALVTIKVESDFSIDQALFFSEHLTMKKIPLVGNIFNNIPRPLLAKTEGVYAPIINKRGYNTLGVIPRRSAIASPTVEEFYQELGGEVLAGAGNMQLLVEDIMIGAMTLDSALSYLRRAADKAVILGGDRSDLALAALETSTSVLILTGGLYPDVRVLARADEKNVPVIMVHYDTYTAVEKLSRVTRHLKPDDSTGIRITVENIEEYCNWQAIMDFITN